MMGPLQLMLLALIAATITSMTAAQLSSFGSFNLTGEDRRAFSTPRAFETFEMTNGASIKISTATWVPTDIPSPNNTVTAGTLLQLLGPGTPVVRESVLTSVCAKRMFIRDKTVLDQGRDTDGGCDFLGKDCLEDLSRSAACPNASDVVDPPRELRCNFARNMTSVFLPPSVFRADAFILFTENGVDANDEAALKSFDSMTWPILVTRVYRSPTGDISYLRSLVCARAARGVATVTTTTMSSSGGGTGPTGRPTSTSSSFAGPTVAAHAAMLWGSSLGTAALGAVLAAL
jgi:hypothetical protein